MIKSPTTSAFGALGLFGSLAYLFQAIYGMFHGKEPDWTIFAVALSTVTSNAGLLFAADHKTIVDKVVEVQQEVDEVAHATQGNTEMITKGEEEHQVNVDKIKALTK